jgi:hypothetical protein
MAVNADDRREIVGLHIGPSGAEPSWASFLKALLSPARSWKQAGVRDRVLGRTEAYPSAEGRLTGFG